MSEEQPGKTDQKIHAEGASAIVNPQQTNITNQYNYTYPQPGNAPYQESIPRNLESVKPWNVPHPRNPFFTGRESVLTDLRKKLLSGKTAALTQAIQGLGGIGKTQTATEYAYRHTDDYSAVLWLSAASQEAIDAGFSEIARLLGLPETAAREQTVVSAAVKSWLAANAGWLLILDNADDIALARQTLPSILKGHVLLTTRATALGNVAEPVPIRKLEAQEGALFLLRRARILTDDALISSASDEDRIAALALSVELGGLPLALDQAGAYIEEMPSTPLKYLALNKTRRGELLEQRGSLGEEEHASVTTTFSLALEKVEAANPASADLLRFCAFLAPDAISVEILTLGANALGDVLGLAVKDDITRAEVIRGARRWSLLEYDPKSEMLSVHRLVQAVIQQTMDTAWQRKWIDRTIMAVAYTHPGFDYIHWPGCEQLLPHWLFLAEYIETHGIETAEAATLLNQAGYYLNSRAQYVAGVRVYKHALAIREKVLGPEHADTARSLNNLALLFQNQGEYSIAEPLLKRALAIREKVLGPEHPDTASSLNNLARLHDTQSNYKAAEPLLKRALSIRTKIHGPEHPDTAQSIHNLATFYWNQDNYADAEPLFKRALAIREKILGLGHPDTAISLNNLSYLYQSQGNATAAEPLLKRALAIREKVLGSEHPWTVGCMEHYAELLRKIGRDTEADTMATRAIEGRNQYEERNKKV